MNTDKLREKYVTDADAMASKSRFGYFSMLPSHTAAHTDFPPARPHRDNDGRVICQPRNIYGGASSTGSLRKNYFSYLPSPFHGSAFQDPGKHERVAELEVSRKWQEKDRFKPAKLNKTLVAASYPYMSETDPKQVTKNHRNADGKVITQNPNICTNPQSKITYNSLKQFKYIECPPEKKKEKEVKETTGEDDEPFKTGNPKQETFATNYQVYFDSDLKKIEPKESTIKVVTHEGPFKPSCNSKGQTFTKVTYKEEGNGKPIVEKVKKSENNVEPFKLLKVEHNSKPCPSISLSKVNLLRVCR